MLVFCKTTKNTITDMQTFTRDTQVSPWATRKTEHAYLKLNFDEDSMTSFDACNEAQTACTGSGSSVGQTNEL